MTPFPPKPTMPPSPQILRHNGGTAPHFHSTVSVQKLRRLSTLILVLRLASFCFALASAVFMATARSDSANWVDYDAFRFVVAANAIVAVYSFVEMWVSVWEILKGGTLLPEAVQVWFDFGHDQGFAYLLLSANAAGTSLARTMRGSDTCTAASAFCVQSYISISLGFAAFLFLLVSSLFSGFRVACFLITGSRFHL